VGGEKLKEYVGFVINKLHKSSEALMKIRRPCGIKGSVKKGLGRKGKLDIQSVYNGEFQYF